MFLFYKNKLIKKSIDELKNFLENDLNVDFINVDTYFDEKGLLKFNIDVIYTDQNSISYYGCVSNNKKCITEHLKGGIPRLLVHSFTNIRDINNVYAYPFIPGCLNEKYLFAILTNNEKNVLKKILLDNYFTDIATISIELPKFKSLLLKKEEKYYLNLDSFEKKLIKTRKNINDNLERIDDISIVISISEFNELFDEAINIIDNSSDWIKYKNFLDSIEDIDKALIDYINLNDSLKKVELEKLEKLLENNIINYSKVFKQN